MTINTQVTKGQRNATRALLVFCKSHGHASGWLERLSACLEALEAGNANDIESTLLPFQHAGMGSFIDWFPNPVQEHEDDNYVETLWNALYGHWREQLKPYWRRRRSQ